MLNNPFTNSPFGSGLIRPLLVPVFSMSLLLGAGAMMVGCQDGEAEDALEEVGESVDDAADNVKDASNDAVHDTKDAIKDATN